MPIIQQLLTLFLPVIGLTVPGILKQDKLKSWQNEAIAGAIVILCSVGFAYTRDQLGPDFLRDAVIVFSGMEVLLQGKLKAFDAYLQSNIFVVGKTLTQPEALEVDPGITTKLKAVKPTV